MLRNPLRPGGPRKTNPTIVRISTVAAGRMPASMTVSGILVRAAGRGVDAQTWNADTVSFARRCRHLRTKGAGHDARLQPAAGRGVDAQTRNANTRHIRVRASACPNDKEAGRMPASIVYFVSGRDGAKTTHCVSK